MQITTGPDRRNVLLGMAATGLAACATTPGPSDPLVARVKQGAVRGAVEREVLAFKGVPYGAPTGGAGRFMPPKPAASWSGVRDTLAWGANAPQVPIARYAVLESWDAGFDAVPQSEDCLVLNVWTPKLRDGKARPVMFYLHGGGFHGRSGSRDCFNGANLARLYDVVVVTINQRLNLFGYGYFAHLDPRIADSGNAGTLDSILALEWVRDNIAEFGGNPGSVTIFGQSGGGAKVTTLLGSPAAQGLFHRAIVQSGPMLLGAQKEDAGERANAFLRSLNLPATAQGVAQLQQMPMTEVVAGLVRAGRTNYSDRSHAPVVDGRTLPSGPFWPGAPEMSKGVPIMVGTTKTETTMLTAASDATVFTMDEARMKTMLRTYVAADKIDATVAEFRATRPQATPADIFFAISTTRRFRQIAVTQAELRAKQAGGAPVWLYEIAWKTPVDGGKWGSPHSMDHGMTFHNLEGGETMYGETPELARMAEQVAPTWVAFARNGNPNNPAIPNWPAYDAQAKPTMVFDLQSALVNNLRPRDMAAVADMPVLGERGGIRV